MARLREGGRAGPMWITTTPKGRNWLYECRSEMTIFQAATRDNPYLSPEFVGSLEASYTGPFARQELYGEFVAFEGLVYEEFDRAVHVAAWEGPWMRVLAGMDEGYANPSVILVMGLDAQGRAHALDEFYQRRVLQMDVVAEAGRLRERHGIEMFYVDPSAAGLIAEMRAAGLSVMPANHDVREGIKAVKARLAKRADGRPGLTFSPSCANTISEFEGYQWKEGKDEPVKMGDHALDSLRYILLSMSQTGPRVRWLRYGAPSED